MRSSIRKACVRTDIYVTSANYSSMAPRKKRTRSRVSASPPPELEPKKFQKVNADANHNLADDGNVEWRFGFMPVRHQPDTAYQRSDAGGAS